MNFPSSRARGLPGLLVQSLRCASICLALSLLPATPTAAFDLQGHRGARGHAPENTLPAFEKALAIGVTTLELDTGVTADGVVVIAHDRALNPLTTRDARGEWLASPGPLIRSLTLAQLEAYDVGRLRPDTAYARDFSRQQPRDGTRIPTLDALFRRVTELGAHEVQFNIETKIDPRSPGDTLAPEPFVKALLAVIRDHGMVPRVMIQSFDWRTLRLVQQLEPRIRTVYLTIQSHPRADTVADGLWTAGLTLAQHGSVPAMVKAAGGSVWSPHYRDLTPPLIQQAHALGLRVVPWTVNETADIERVMGLGIDGIISDYPDRVREVMRQRGMPVPPALRP